MRHWASRPPVRGRLALLALRITSKTGTPKAKTPASTSKTFPSPPARAPGAPNHTTRMNQTHPNPSTMAAPDPLFFCSFTSCRRRGQSPGPFTTWGTYFTHTKRLHLTTHPILASSTAAQTAVFADALDAHNKRLCVRFEAVVGKAQTCAGTAPCNGATVTPPVLLCPRAPPRRRKRPHDRCLAAGSRLQHQ